MVRILVIVGVVVLVLVVGGGILLYLAYGLTDRPPASLRVPGIGDSAAVETFADGSVRIRAKSERDAYMALGYVHAEEHGWTMALYRRSALGRLSEWFGDDMLELDRLALRLGISRGAREAYGTLAERNREVLAAYARGVNAAFGRSSAFMRHEFVALTVEPEEWEPWHALAVERLVAWLAAERPDVDTLRMAGGALAEFFDADELMRTLLHLHGFESSLAWTLRDSSGVRLFQRHVYGATALPLYQSVVIERPGEDPLTGGSLVGTPFMPAGKNAGRSWAVLLSSALSLQRAVRDPAQIALSYERLVSADGEEHLVRIDRSSDTDVFFPAPRAFYANASTFSSSDTTGSSAARPSGSPIQSKSFPSDSTDHRSQEGWVLRWSGFLAGSDVDAWQALSDGVEPTAFHLFDGDGIVLDAGGDTRVLGRPLVTRSFREGSLVSNSAWSTYVADRLDTLVNQGQGLADPAEFADDYRSAWAAYLAPSLVASAIAVPNQPAIVTEALAFLRNWDFAYDRASIAASIFDTWTSVYRDSLGRLPEPSDPDSAQVETLLLYELLVKAVETLVDEHGDNLSQWRWEDVQPHRFYFPIFSADSILSTDVASLPRTRYDTIEIPGSGHPTTPLWGPSFFEPGLLSPARWEATVSTADRDAMRVRSRNFRPNRFFGRYLVSDRTPEASPVAAPDRLKHTTLLLP